jgi:hypothetical protein
MSKIVIIGGGAAGLLCAAKSAEKGNDVVIIEKMNRCGRKLMITGKGRCNVTNASFELDDLISNVPTNPRFLYSAFSNFMPYDTMALFEELGVALKIERGNRVFPVSDKAVDIVDALVNYAKNSGVKIIQGTAKAFEFNNNKINSVVLEDKSKIECDKVCLCTGGKSYHLTGSTGDGYILAKSAGHTIVPPKPSLVPLECSNNFIKVVFRPFVKLAFKLKIKGLENVPPKGTKYIVAINHTCALDPIFVACSKNIPPLHFMAKAELFENPIAAWFMTHMYSFPVRRGKGDTSAIEYGEKILNEGHVMAICKLKPPVYASTSIISPAKYKLSIIFEHIVLGLISLTLTPPQVIIASSIGRKLLIVT